MAKIPFSIDYKPQIESGEYKVETRNGLPARIICWDRKVKDMEILALVYEEHTDEDNEDVAEVALNGRMFPRGQENDYDLFIITPEPELTDWQKFISGCLQKHGLLDCGSADRVAKECSAELLELAKKELIEEQLPFNPSKKEDHESIYTFMCGVEHGRAEALRDLPKWKKVGLDTGQTTLVVGYTKDEDKLYRNGYVISLSGLEKLQKEDEK